jgi:hypothetical protein
MSEGLKQVPVVADLRVAVRLQTSIPGGKYPECADRRVYHTGGRDSELDWRECQAPALRQPADDL